MSHLRRLAALALGVLAGVGAARQAHAINCSELPGPVYGLGGSASKPFLAKVSKALANAPGPDTQTIVFQAPGACLGIYAVLNGTKLTGTASYWDATGVEKQCDLPLGGQAVDFANMANSAVLCADAPDPLPADVGDFEGSVNTVNIIVPLASSQTSISAAAAYFVFGFGAAGQAAPWIVDAAVIIRDVNSAVQQLLAEAIGLPPARFKGTNGASQSGVITKVSQSLTPEAAIGFVSGEAADAARATVRTLAYQHYDQTCGYLPDSTSTSFDKANVRDGHYFIWTPQHFFTRVDPTSHEVVSPGFAKVVGYLTGAVPVPGSQSWVDLEIASSTIPRCAMHVTREGDLGPLMSFAPTNSCSCYFDFKATGSTTCTACTESSQCPTSAPVCSYGYCEVQ
jgi:hypothetical protein